MRTEETTHQLGEQSGSNPKGRDEIGMTFFIIFFLNPSKGQQRQLYFLNKILLSSVPVLFTL